MNAANFIRIGTRGSALALAQARLVADRLAAHKVETALEVVTSDGDRDKSTPLTVLGGRGVFASSLQQALHAGQIDLAVHSAKDLPTVRPSGLTIAAFVARDDPRDVLVSRHGVPLRSLPPNPVIGTSSRRRMVQILAVRPDARCVDLRGNIDSRLRKAFDSELDGIVLAAAGILRLGWSAKITEFLDLDAFVPAPGQAALAVEVRSADDRVLALVSGLDEPAVRAAVDVERAFLSEIGAGCTVPVGALADVVGGERISLRAMVAGDDTGTPVWRNLVCGAPTAEAEARALARAMQREAGLDRQSPQAANDWRHLLGKTVLITRPTRVDDPLAGAIRLAGGIPLISPAVMVAARHPDRGDLEIVRSFAEGAFDWVAFTSGYAARYFAELSARVGASMPAGTRVAVIGEGTAAAALRAGFRADLRAPEASGGQLAEALAGHNPRPANVLFVRGSRARPDFAETLRSAAVPVTELTVYDTQPAVERDQEMVARLLRNEIDAVTLLSPSAVEGFRAQAGEVWERARLVPAVCIGQTTASASRTAGMVHVHVSGTASVDGIVAALQTHVRTYIGQPAGQSARNEEGKNAS